MTWVRLYWCLGTLIVATWLAGAGLYQLGGETAALYMLRAMAILCAALFAVFIARVIIDAVREGRFVWRLYRAPPGSQAERDLIFSRGKPQSLPTIRNEADNDKTGQNA